MSSKNTTSYLPILFYSTLCSNSKQVLLFIIENGLLNEMNFLSVDRRRRLLDGAIEIKNEQGQTMILPAQVDMNRLPCLLFTADHKDRRAGSVLAERDIMLYFSPQAELNHYTRTNGQGENRELRTIEGRSTFKPVLQPPTV